MTNDILQLIVCRVEDISQLTGKYGFGKSVLDKIQVHCQHLIYILLYYMVVLLVHTSIYIYLHHELHT
jgi:hypothetical protein